MKYIRLFVLCLALTAWGCTGAELSPDGVGDGTEEIPGDSDGGNGGSGDEGGNNGGGEETPLEYFYKRVDVEPLDWSGDYLIAYDNGTELMLLDSWSDKSGKSTKSFGISDFDAAGGGIPAEKGDSYKAVVTKDGASYTINIKGIGIKLPTIQNPIAVTIFTPNNDAAIKPPLSSSIGTIEIINIIISLSSLF